MADFAFTINEPKLFKKASIKVIKNRHDINEDLIIIDIK
mgnify:CR=1 FL=1